MQASKPVAGMFIQIRSSDIVFVEAHQSTQIGRQAVLIVRGVAIVTHHPSAEMIDREHLDGHHLIVTHHGSNEAFEILTDAQQFQADAFHHPGLNRLAIQESFGHLFQVPRSTWLLFMAIMHNRSHQPFEVIVHGGSIEGAKSTLIGGGHEIQGVLTRHVAEEILLHTFHVLLEDLLHFLLAELLILFRGFCWQGHLNCGAQQQVHQGNESGASGWGSRHFPLASGLHPWWGDLIVTFLLFFIFFVVFIFLGMLDIPLHPCVQIDLRHSHQVNKVRVASRMKLHLRSTLTSCGFDALLSLVVDPNPAPQIHPPDTSSLSFRRRGLCGLVIGHSSRLTKRSV
mmetsp:Transcript_72745/g.115490  ORF Transcript_72745/g.115490 Transcript_72745/m.115490 type:complete len:341 (+) Transcript_72745:543-1565(+)